MRKLSLLFTFILVFTFVNAQEICDNAIDDDNNGFIDLNDPACDCNGIGAPPTVLSLVPNPSFESFNCCPNILSQLSCADNWIQASFGSSDYFNCGFGVGNINSVITAPDGTGFVGSLVLDNYQEYIGTCLSGPLIAGETYSLTFNIASLELSPNSSCPVAMDDINISIFGTSSCGSLPLSNYGCPTTFSSAWSLIDSEIYTPNSNWEIITIEFTPTIDINEIIIGPPCILPLSFGVPSCQPYFLYDNFQLESINAYNSLEISDQGDYCNGDLVLNATSDTIGGNWQWYLEGVAIIGETNNVLNVSTAGLGGGKYEVKYSLGALCETEYFNVDQEIVANYGHVDVCLGETVAFSDSSVVDTNGVVLINSWEWNFDNGSTSSSQNPNVSFTTPGAYNVQLKVSTNNSCIDSITKTVIVHPSPIADFDFDTFCIDVISDFVDLSSSNGGTLIDSWIWDFDDGSTSVLENPTHIYTIDGNYSVSLVVESIFGCKDSIAKNVFAGLVPNADFSATSECLENETDFADLTNISSTNANNSITIWEWDFGDGSTSNLENPSYEYANDGTYNVSLNVTTNHGCTNEISKIVVVHPVPEVNFVGINREGCSPICSEFNSTTIVNAPSTIDNLDWTVSNGSNYQGSGFSECFESPVGSSIYYDITLTATS
ncbi:PKD domain-containing protein, partial [Brumimicrobium mesophilum]|uniref:PKD domain-containing protein n=1 Tax=Brumimicrobium mesophilum TaxID=392717 RepID=UPI00131B4F88